MDIDLTTLILEIVNFLVLVWLLKRFLYQPVLNVVSQRQQSIQARLDEAESARSEAEKIRRDYETRVAAIESEHRETLRQLDEELQAKRSAALKDIRMAANLEEEKLRTARQNKDVQWRRDTEQQSLQLATRFVSRILRVVADDYLHQRLTDFAIKSLEQLPDTEVEALRQTLEPDQAVTVNCAFPLGDSQQQALKTWCKNRLGVSGVFNCAPDSRLIAGIRLAIGSWSLGFNLADELKGFADCIHEGYSLHESDAIDESYTLNEGNAATETPVDGGDRAVTERRPDNDNGTDNHAPGT